MTSRLRSPRSRDSGRGAGDNLIPVSRFAESHIGSIPEGWELRVARPSLAPRFVITKRDGKAVLLAGGNGSEDCAGWLVAPVAVQGGRTYRLSTRLSFSRDLNPQQHLLFAFYTPHSNDGIFRFQRLADSRARGEGKFRVPGRGRLSGEVRIGFRLSPAGKAWIESIELEECRPIAPRPVIVTCVQGESSGLAEWDRVLGIAARAGADLVLLPEVMNGHVPEPLRGPSAQLMARRAAQHQIYVAGGILHFDRSADRVYNTALLFGRRGRLVGRYQKNHPYSPEVNDSGITPGVEAPVFATDFGTVGIIICYDGWFTDVTELLALKGAEIILFPNAGYYRSLMPARAADRKSVV